MSLKPILAQGAYRAWRLNVGPYWRQNLGPVNAAAYTKIANATLDGFILCDEPLIPTGVVVVIVTQ